MGDAKTDYRIAPLSRLSLAPQVGAEAGARVEEKLDHRE